MSIIRKVRRVERLFHVLEEEVSNFQNETQLRCLLGCGSCCFKPDIEATVLEFLPFAFEQFIAGKSDQLLTKLEENLDPVCILFEAGSHSQYQMGRCGEYTHRGLICRLFGFSSVRDKSGNPRLSTCGIIKKFNPESYDLAANQVEKGIIKAPTYIWYYQKLSDIDFRLGQEYHPINNAIKRAIQEVHNYFMYRPIPRKYRKVA